MSGDGRSLFAEQELPPCPRCGAAKIIPVVFGLPGDELMERAQRGEVALGGCMPMPSILGACMACGHWRTGPEDAGTTRTQPLADCGSAGRPLHPQ